jgi:hypothetical protein
MTAALLPKLRPSLAFTLHVRIDDRKAFARAAVKQAVADGIDEDAARVSSRDLGWCATMLFDPGTSPDGCTLLDSSTETA